MMLDPHALGAVLFVLGLFIGGMGERSEAKKHRAELNVAKRYADYVVEKNEELEAQIAAHPICCGTSMMELDHINGDHQCTKCRRII